MQKNKLLSLLALGLLGTGAIITNAVVHADTTATVSSSSNSISTSSGSSETSSSSNHSSISSSSGSSITNNTNQSSKQNLMDQYATSQVPVSMTNYWNNWRQVKLTQPIQIQKINYISDASLDKDYGETQTLPNGTVIYIKGWNLGSGNTSNSYFQVALSKQDPVMNGNFKTTNPFWSTGLSSFDAFQLTNDNDQIQKLSLNTASFNNFNRHFRRGFLQLDMLSYQNQPILSSSYQNALKARQAIKQYNHLTDQDLNNKAAYRTVNRLRNASPKVKSVQQVIYVRNYKNGIAQIRLNNKTYYSDINNFVPYNTTTSNNNGINSTQLPSNLNSKQVVANSNVDYYTTTRQTWTTITITKNGQARKQTFTYNGNQWLTFQQWIQWFQANKN